MKFKRHTLPTIYHYRLCNLYETLYSVNLYMLYTVPDTFAIVLVRAFEKKDNQSLFSGNVGVS